MVAPHEDCLDWSAREGPKEGRMWVGWDVNFNSVWVQGMAGGDVVSRDEAA